MHEQNEILKTKSSPPKKLLFSFLLQITLLNGCFQANFSPKKGAGEKSELSKDNTKML